MLQLILLGVVYRVNDCGVSLVHEKVVKLFLLSLDDCFLNDELAGLSNLKVLSQIYHSEH